jgi:hypothetical protein
MSCLQPNLVPSISELPSNVPNPVLVSTSGPWLPVSNAPEEVLLNGGKAQYLLNDGLPAPQVLLIGGNTSSQPIVVEMTNGGGATLPVNLSLIKSVVYPTPAEGAQ